MINGLCCTFCRNFVPSQKTQGQAYLISFYSLQLTFEFTLLIGKRASIYLQQPQVVAREDSTLLPS